jgi:dihydropteroate synthase
MIVAQRRPYELPLRGRHPLQLGSRTLIMGVLNVTPDSFSDGGRAFEPSVAIARALEMEAAGADIIDVGAESTRPGAEPVDQVEEWRRLNPVLNGLASRLRIPISIDTYRAKTAFSALRAGAAIVNDISGLAHDAELADVASQHGAALVLMHSRGRSYDMYREANYENVPTEIARELQQSVERAVGCGVARDRIVLDPGFGFGKRAPHSLIALAHFDAFAALDRPLLSGPSRKSFLTSATGPLPPAQRDWATAAAVTASILAGAHIVRVHRLAEMVHVVRVADAIRAAGAGRR